MQWEGFNTVYNVIELFISNLTWLMPLRYKHKIRLLWRAVNKKLFGKFLWRELQNDLHSLYGGEGGKTCSLQLNMHVNIKQTQ